MEAKIYIYFGWNDMEDGGLKLYISSKNWLYFRLELCSLFVVWKSNLVPNLRWLMKCTLTGAF